MVLYVVNFKVTAYNLLKSQAIYLLSATLLVLKLFKPATEPYASLPALSNGEWYYPPNNVSDRFFLLHLASLFPFVFQHGFTEKMYPNLGEYPLPVWSYVIKTSRMLGISINTIISLCRNESLLSDQETALFTSTELDTQSLYCKKTAEKPDRLCSVTTFSYSEYWKVS